MALSEKQKRDFRIACLGYGSVIFIILIILGAYGAAMLNFCVCTALAWTTADKELRTQIAWIGLGVIIVSSFFVVYSNGNTIDIWFASKLVFVVYFALFSGHLVEKYSKGNIYVYLGVLVALLFVCLLAKWIMQVDKTHFLYCIQSALKTDGIYGWSDFIEDIAFGFAGAFAAELTKATLIEDPPTP
jgi:hypothetical protein